MKGSIFYFFQKKTIFFLCFLFFSQIHSVFSQQMPYYATLVPYRKGELWGFCDWRKNMVIPPQYQEVKLFINELAKVKNGDKWGLIDQKGEVFVPIRYDLVYGASKQTHITVCKGGDASGHKGKWGFTPKYKGLTKAGFEEIPLQYDLIRESGEAGLLAIMQNNLWGIITSEGRIQISPQFEVEKVENHSFFDKNQSITNPEIGFLEEKNFFSYLKLKFQNQLARVKKNQKWGYINPFGNEVLALEYDFVSEISENMATCVKNNQILFWNTKTKTFLLDTSQLDLSFYKKQVYKNGLVAVKKAGKFGFLDTKAILQVPCVYAQVHNFNENIALASQENDINPNWHIINPKNEKLGEILNKYQLIDTQFEGGFVRVKYQNLYYFLDKQGKSLLEEGLQYADIFQGNYALAVNIEGKMGYLSANGGWFLPDEYEFEKQNFFPEVQYDLFKVKKNGKWGIVGAKNQIIIPFMYDDLRFVPLKIDQKPKRNLRFIAKKNGKFGVISIKNKVLIAFLYEKFFPFVQYLALVQKQGKLGYISEKGQEFWE